MCCYSHSLHQNKILCIFVSSTIKIILSDILQSQQDELTRAYQTHLDIYQVYTKNEWLLAEVTRR